MKSALIRVPRKSWGREGKTERREQSWGRGGGLTGWWFNRGNGGGRRFGREKTRFESPNPAGQGNSKSHDGRASLTHNRACLRDEPLWCRKPTRGASWCSTSSARRATEIGSFPLCPLRSPRRNRCLPGVYCYLTVGQVPVETLFANLWPLCQDQIGQTARAVYYCPPSIT